MVSRKYGIPEILANLYYKTLTNTKYRVKIIGGTKRYVYSNNKKTPIYGTGQGSGNSLIIWLFIYDIIAQIMEENAIGATYLGKEKQQSIEIKMTAYVDDVNTHHTNNPGEHNIESNMRHNYNTWKSRLEASGGQLDPEKSNYYITKWNFQTSSKPKLELATPTYNQNCISEVISAIQTWHRLLGINISPENQVIIQQERWNHKEKHMLNILKMHSMSYKEAEVMYKTI
jgi:hypothetical protein